ncbi:hypoxia-inducible factor 1-alpha isoform X1 [Ooceraea biroi]|uniref:hypoxia-inducible factor 1-alpha isoform X1 n=1 Tax=Ooceraea biroi TaxID=2015173 RepID=UPI0005BE748E|nr:hypoxia-inducible factor 1-alpha isoform X1 [Ooceraea biroi]
MDTHRKERKHKEKRRSNEKRKERSRDAARCRRSRETDIFAELAAALPIAPEQAVHLDKASVMRLAIAYLKVRAVVDSIPVSLAKSESSSAEMDELFPKALNGFILVLSSDGNMIYLSENVSDYLGVSQMDMMGQSVYEYSHPCDHDELRECLSLKPTDNGEERTCSFFLRLKCTLTSKGRKVNLKSASYKVIHCTGRLVNIRDSNSNTMEVDDEEREKEDESSAECDTGASLILVGCPIPHPSNIEIPLGRHTFLSKHNLNMKFTYADEKLAEYLGWNSEELIDRSVFEFYHALDNPALDKCFKCLFSKGQCETVAYRFLGKRGGYAWVVTQATLIHCSKQQKPISVVCVNYVLSEVEHEDEVYSVRQLAARDSGVDLVKSERTLPALVPIEGAGPVDSTRQVVLDEEVPGEDAANSSVDDESKGEDRPLAVTASIFHSAGGKDEQERKDGSGQDNVLPRPIQEKAFVQALKESLEESIKESLKENDEPAPGKRQNCRSLARTPFVFQGKPAVERDSSGSIGCRDQPQAVTRHLFAPLPLTVQQQQQQQQQEQPQLSCRPSPQTATASIFAPRTEDMNKGFLTFSEDQPGLTMLKDEPEDLTHLAPTAGDVCVPLEDTPFLSDMLDQFIFGNDNYGCPLLSPGDTLTPELRSADLSESLKDADLVDTGRTKDAADRLADSDPFMYGDSPGSPCSIDPSTVSPSLSKYQQSPERSVDSLDSPTGGSGGDGLSEDEMLMLGISDSVGDDEMALRAPYIPMSDQDEALELLISEDMVMWDSPQSVDKGSSKWLLDDREQRGSESTLAQMLRTDQMILRQYNDHGGGLMNPTQILGQTSKKPDAIFESDRWSCNQERTDRPSNKRLHPGIHTDSASKRLKCEGSLFERINLEDPLLTRQQRSPTTLHKKSAPIFGSSAYGSQLLRRLVSSQTSSVTSHAVSSSNDGGGDGKRRHDIPEQRSRVLDDIIDLAEAEGDRGGGGGGGRSHGDSLNKFDAISRRKWSCGAGAGGSSVLMNLLVSGCDDPLMNSRNVPTLSSRNLTSPLSVNVDNQMVPQCASKNNVTSLPDHLSPDTRKHLIGPFTGGGTTPIVSPTTSVMASFDSFDYDESAGLLQVGSDLLGSLLDRGLV